MSDICRKLKRYNLTEYEAKAYLALLKLGKSTAREIGEATGIPQGRIYSVLKSLGKEGFVVVHAGSPMYYSAQDPREIFSAIRERYCEEIQDLIRELVHYQSHLRSSSPFWTIHSEQGILILLKTIIRNAEKEVIIITDDPSAIKQIKRTLQAVRKRINITILVFDKKKFVGTGMKTIEISSDLADFFRDMHEGYKVLNYDYLGEESFFLIDGRKALSTGYLDGEKCANVIDIPTPCYMTRKLISIYEPGIPPLT